MADLLAAAFRLPLVVAGATGVVPALRVPPPPGRTKADKDHGLGGTLPRATKRRSGSAAAITWTCAGGVRMGRCGRGPCRSRRAGTRFGWGGRLPKAVESIFDP